MDYCRMNDSCSEKYNYKTVATKIQQAKTSISAGQAVLAAKRETLKLKRKIASGSGDAEELHGRKACCCTS